ncbi:MAG: patatin-like phospholipase family protein [Comamonadaceae bacterium]|nr:patatin-like phospholipase family protein [Comamonadaceae bacterium]
MALSGGGYLGLYAAVVLADLEARVGEPLGRRFDLIAGTSVGGLLAMALAFEVPMRELVKLFLERGEEVFSSRRLPSGAVSRLLDLSRSVMGPKYTGEALRKELTRYFGKCTLGDALHAVVVPAVDVTRSVTKVFKTPHAQASLGDAAYSAVDVTLATCAAPAFFPSVYVGDKLYADGGLFAVAPDQVALHEAEHFMGAKPARVRMLSVGTAAMGYQPADKPEADVGAVGWLSEGRLIMTMLAAQQQHVQAIMEDRLEERYMRLDAHWPAQAGLGIDVATKQAAQTLIALGHGTLQTLDEARLAKFL